ATRRRPGRSSTRSATRSATTPAAARRIRERPRSPRSRCTRPCRGWRARRATSTTSRRRASSTRSTRRSPRTSAQGRPRSRRTRRREDQRGLVTAGTPSLTVPGARRLRLPARLETHALSLALLAVFALVVAVEAPGELVQDSWLTLVAGREIAHHGLPQHDTLYALTAGHRWIDQQWLAQLAFYGLAVLGGLRLVLIAHAACLVGAARRRGASSAAVLLTGFVCLLTAPWALQMRAQSIAELLFAACFALLLEERPGARRVAGVLALLVLWANVHGSVLLGVGFAVLRAAFLIARRQRGLGIFLALTAPACVFVSPYGLALGGYYRTMLVDPKLRKYVDEWHWSTPSRHTVAFYSVLLCGALLVWRY